MATPLVYISYILSALVAFGLYVGLPREGRLPRRGGFILVFALMAGVMVYLFEWLSASTGVQIPFYILTILGLAAAVRVVTHPRPVYSALYFVFVVIATAAMLVMVGAEFLGFALIIVYAGAILVTYVFVIMLSQTSSDGKNKLASVLDYDRSAREPVWATFAGFMLMAVLVGMITGRVDDSNMSGPSRSRAVVMNASSTDGGPGVFWPDFNEAQAAKMARRNTVDLGRLLMTDLAVSVELAAVLLMVAMVGAIAVARRKLPQPDLAGESLPPGEIGRRVRPF